MRCDHDRLQVLQRRGDVRSPSHLRAITARNKQLHCQRDCGFPNIETVDDLDASGRGQASTRPLQITTVHELSADLLILLAWRTSPAGSCPLFAFVGWCCRRCLARHDLVAGRQLVDQAEQSFPAASMQLPVRAMPACGALSRRGLSSGRRGGAHLPSLLSRAPL